METIGLLGGMSWESTIPYYRLINERVREQMGGLHSAKLVLYSVDFAEIERLQHKGEWEQAGHRLGEAAYALERAGADFLVICTNTMHRVLAQIEAHIQMPVLHIADATATHIQKNNIGCIGLLGTRFTMEQDFYRGRLEQFGLKVLVPNDNQREQVHRIIYDELCLGQCLPKSRRTYQEIMKDLVDAGAQGIILGCTEISLLVKNSDVSVPLFDTTLLHAHAAADRALND